MPFSGLWGFTLHSFNLGCKKTLKHKSQQWVEWEDPFATFQMPRSGLLSDGVFAPNEMGFFTLAMEGAMHAAKGRPQICLFFNFGLIINRKDINSDKQAKVLNRLLITILTATIKIQEIHNLNNIINYFSPMKSQNI